MTTVESLVQQKIEDNFIPTQTIPTPGHKQVVEVVPPTTEDDTLGLTHADIDILSATQNYSPWVSFEEISLIEDYSSSLVGLTTDGFTSLTNEDIPFNY